MLFHFSDLAPIQIYDHAYSLIGIYSEKLGASTSASSFILHTTAESRQ
jgi:hypothetical protein